MAAIRTDEIPQLAISEESLSTLLLVAVLLKKGQQRQDMAEVRVRICHGVASSRLVGKGTSIL